MEPDSPIDWKAKYPLLPLRDIVIFPGMTAPLFIGRPGSINALDAAFESNRLLMLSAQKEASTNDPKPENIFEVGCVARIAQIMRLPDGAVKALVEGIERAEVKKYHPAKERLVVTVKPVVTKESDMVLLDATRRSAQSLFDQLVRLLGNEHDELAAIISDEPDPERFSDLVAANFINRVQEKQLLLSEKDMLKRLEHLSNFLQGEIEVAKIERRVRSRVKKQMDKSQRDYYLNEQMKAIQKELTGVNEGEKPEFEELAEKIKAAGMPKDVEKKAFKELRKLEQMPPMSSEGTVSRNYIDWLVEVPWSKRTRDKLDIKKAGDILDEDHYGLTKIKERILEYLAVRKLVTKMKGPVLCFVGPPGVGKTSLGRSIARAMGRKFIRFSLGGVRDEAEIRGHRRTYVGALPGRIIQSMKKAGTKNPVIMLDEIDKVGSDYRGDPSAALLEALDPEQNNEFNDHYLEVDYDLSEVMFVTTANVMHTVPAALRDRMEVIEISGYSDDEKERIARQFLIEKQETEHGLPKGFLKFSDDALLKVIRNYTRESGVRELERRIGAVCRKVAKNLAEKGSKKGARKKETIGVEKLIPYLGQIRYRDDALEKKDEIGVASGLAWTSVGGSMLKVETSLLNGKGKFILTGKLGDVMKESAQTALSYIRSRQKELGLQKGFYEKYDIHIHIPEGAIPKEGPSAGVTLITAMVSSLTKTPVRKDVAMTGEITLRGQVLPIGGLKEKLLAAKRAGVSTVLIPEQNSRDLSELPDKLKEDIKIVTVESMDDVLKHALVAPKKKRRATRKAPPRGGAKQGESQIRPSLN